MSQFQDFHSQSLEWANIFNTIILVTLKPTIK